MAVITRAYSEVTGQIAYASSINRIIDDIYTLQAGNIGVGNIANSGIGHTAVGLSAINNCNINSLASIDYAKLGGSSAWVAQRIFLEGF